MIVRVLHDKGLRSDHAFDAALASVGLSFLAWLTSRRKEKAGKDRADRWGIFVGEWAPTFFGLGLALQHYEQDEEKGELG